MCSRSFATPVTQLTALDEAVSQFAWRVAEKLRQQHGIAGAVHVFITTSPFRKHDRQHSPSVTLPLVRPTADTRLFIGAAPHALQGMYRPGFSYDKAGVMLVDLRPVGHEPGELDLFASDEQTQTTAGHRDRSRLMGAVWMP